ncbi:type VII toxin-antitoxin system HepT family RNase toxin [Desulfonatronum thioautotrophicum]|uniref:type VII toxin-antitoxin system HepT family RNase toxin n=1 Tax=Desulfonatronum thioautotrophicum TaxID=617001 RepID=UPI0005EAEA19|nr:DUF86 domain-containing protein [Desulfonatronum thioautotrophicum]
MSPDKMRSSVVLSRVEWVRKMLTRIRELPLHTREHFFQDPRNAAAAESNLRRALEALFDLGRHITAKVFGQPSLEYKQIAVTLGECGVLSVSHRDLLRVLAGYRNRLTHFYSEIDDEELFRICRDHIDDVERLLDAMLQWIRANPDKMDQPIPHEPRLQT